ncbi:hypothetical protein GCM10010912_37670 [Paenibacillus albidus]|uniref:DUF1963 domain-containing protein n=1 Tax=Paenibacillus albidus TaxID=2041023 RepID=A0A917CK63_9BACL|nr:YwqG family protein [Paenibacillus albidus]GGF89010.1 hypothetical protein GCM10010912_37670 [Paenibacillus albidus]
MLPLSLQDSLSEFIRKQGLEGQAGDLLKALAETSLVYELAGEEDYVRTGNSRIAGCPDLPPSFSWPLDPDGEYWTFLAQINLGELPLSPVELLPREGMLYFFLGLDEPAYDIDHRIYYYNGNMNELIRTSPPEGREEIGAEDRDFKSYKITFKPVWTLPEQAADLLLNDYPEAYEALEPASDTLWGQYQSWAGNTPLDAYLCRNGLQDILFGHYKTPEKIREEARAAEERGSADYAQRLLTKALPQLTEYKQNQDKHKAAAANWHLLFSVSSLDEVGMCWWDAGYLEFFIDKADLEQLDFSRTYVNLATS